MTTNKINFLHSEYAKIKKQASFFKNLADPGQFFIKKNK